MTARDFTAVSSAPLAQRMRWYASLNCWLAPTDFPVSLPDCGDDHAAKSSDPLWSAAWRSLDLSDAESSLGWWLYELKRTAEEWRAWWTKDFKRSAAEADGLIAKLAAQP